MTASSALADSRDVDFAVSLRGSGAATIHAVVHENPANRGVTTVLAVHGFTGTAATWEPLANAMFADPALGSVVKRVIAIEFPGHGDSSLPTLPSPLRFSDLTIEDNVSVVIQSIDALRSQKLAPQVIIGHSMGGLIVQATQEALLSSNSSLAKHGVFGAILLSGAPNRNVHWTVPAGLDISPFIVMSDAALGPYLDLPPFVGQLMGGWTDLSGNLVPGTPSVEFLATSGWFAIEPLTTALELFGASAPLWRPAVRENAFAAKNGTVLAVISLSQDVLVPAIDQPALYRYLTGGDGPLYRPVVAPDATHCMHQTNPTGLVAALRDCLH